MNLIVGTYSSSTGEPVERTGSFSLSCSSGIADIQGHYQYTYGFGVDTGVDLSNWAKVSDIDISFKFRATCDEFACANFYLKIWGSSGDAHDTYYNRYESDGTMEDWTSTTDSGWRTRTLTLDHDDFDTLTSLTIAWGFIDTYPSDYNLKVEIDYIYIQYRFE